MEPIDAGEALRLRVTFTDDTDAPADPTAVSLTVERPDGAELVYVSPSTITRTGVGLYEKIQTFDVGGSWKWRWVGTGPAGSVSAGAVYVRTSSLDPSAPFTGITGAEVAAWSKVAFDQLDEPFDSVQLDMLVAESSAFISEITGRIIDATLPLQGPNLVSLIRQAVRMRSEQMAYLAQPDSVELNADEAVTSLSAGGFSVTTRGPVRTGKSATGAIAITGWPQLDNVIYLAMSVDRRDYYRGIIDGIYAPYSAVSEVNWDGASHLPYGGQVDPFGPAWGA